MKYCRTQTKLNKYVNELSIVSKVKPVRKLIQIFHRVKKVFVFDWHNFLRLPDVVQVSKLCSFFLECTDSFDSISRCSSEGRIVEKTIKRCQGTRETRAFLELWHFQGQSTSGRLPFGHQAVVLLKIIEWNNRLDCRRRDVTTRGVRARRSRKRAPMMI